MDDHTKKSTIRRESYSLKTEQTNLNACTTKGRVPFCLAPVTQQLADFKLPPTISQHRFVIHSSCFLYLVGNFPICPLLNGWLRLSIILRKEVIQPHLPIRLPCYDFTPIIGPTLGGWLQKVTSPTSGVTDSRGVTGGVYKARERIHRGMLIRDY